MLLGRSMLLEGEIAVVTGSTGGIGECAAHELARHGAQVVVTGRRVEAGNAVAESITDAGGAARFVAADLTRDDDVQAIFATAVNTFGPVTVLVNNAAPTDMIGRADGDGRLTDVAADTFNTIIRVGVRSAYRCCYHAIRSCSRRGTDRSSTCRRSRVRKGRREVFVYSAAKGRAPGAHVERRGRLRDDGIRAEHGDGGLRAVEPGSPGVGRGPPRSMPGCACRT